jgi:uncharacterized protein
MPRKFFRRFLPSHETIRQNRYIAWFGPRLQHHNLWHLHRKSVAGGVAAGLFAGLIPGSNPVQFAAGAILAVVFRVNLSVSVLVTLYSNPFTVVPLYLMAYALGQLVLFETGSAMLPPMFSLEGKGFTEWLPAALDWLMQLGKPVLIGLPLLAVLLAAIGYFAVDFAWRLYVRCAWQRRRERRARSAP